MSWWEEWSRRIEREVERVFRDIDRELRGMAPLSRLLKPGYVRPLMDVIEEDDSIKIIAEVPGVRKEDIDLRIAENYVELSAPLSEDVRKYYHKRRIMGYAFRQEMPMKIASEGAEAKYSNGILEITVPKERAERRGTKIKVE